MIYSFDLRDFEGGKFVATRYPDGAAVGGDWVCRAKSDRFALLKAQKAARLEWNTPDERDPTDFDVDFVDSVRMGRPPLPEGEARTALLPSIRVTEKTRAAAEKAAGTAGQSLTDWAREQIERAL